MVFHDIADISKQVVILKGETASNSHQHFGRFSFQRNLRFQCADISLSIVAGCRFDDDWISILRSG